MGEMEGEMEKEMEGEMEGRWQVKEMKTCGFMKLSG